MIFERTEALEEDSGEPSAFHGMSKPAGQAKAS